MEKQSSSMGFLLLEEVQFLEVNDDALSSQWEFVNVLDSEELGENDDDGDSVDGGFGSGEDSSISWSISPNNGPIEGIHYRILDPDDVDVKEHRGVVDYGNVEPEPHLDDVDEEKPGCQFDDGDADGYRGGKIDDDEEEDDDYSGYDLDDELVPWSVGSKFGRQRMRKLGKRVCSKMNNSKKSPFMFVRPGCVRGKHGLGLKHNF
ncbi:hypothetical protein L6164_033476 [Bauhinia variegata]|uniref:Uncharacterized protein n=1 Tax=Bauhinia variegata TaxID=167791 RepID=A0ACB9KSP6_BAUVA|nr:hypothetical protein L6164_033476 [Bauhinia variegata]